MQKTTKILLLLLLVLALLASAAGGGWYWYDTHVDRSGWVEEDGVRFYRDFHARPVSGWLELPEGVYYLTEGGVPLTGWQDLGGSRRYFHENGHLASGLLTLEEGIYCLDADGIPITGWAALEDGTHYFAETGLLYAGWLDLSGSTYYLPEGILTVGWQETDLGLRYFDPTGAMAVGETQIEGVKYFFQPDGSLRTGWQEDRTYCLDTGYPADGWQDIDGKRYYFGDGTPAFTGWMEYGEYRCYFYEDGSAAVGPADIDGARHYFSPQGYEVLLVNAKNPLPGYYKPELITLTPDHQVAAPCYEALMQMLADCSAAGVDYTFNSAYRTHRVQTAILEENTQMYMERYDIDYAQAQAMALTFVALPGTSEHQLGLAIDLLGKDAVPWLNEHCWDYGFIVRYAADKENITGIIAEPWHFRYVGLEIAQDMKNSGLCLEEYLGAEPVKG